MALKTLLSRLMPLKHADVVPLADEVARLDGVQRLECAADQLRHVDTLTLSQTFGSQEIADSWSASGAGLEALGIPDGTGGINPGDRRALYYLVAAVRPRAVLEIGTHIGASTVHIASALHMASVSSPSPTMVTVDIADVNSRSVKPWLKNGAAESPASMVDMIGYGANVEFVTGRSITYLAGCERTFDFVFIDGDHSAAMVYQEIAAALKVLNADGVIVLHDYFPDLKPLWADGSMIPGPFLAVERLQREGVNLAVVPLRELPWPTKLRSHCTSLALLLRKD
jgi:predicted O-methyltransferase YrrM